jgi:hypothetical protein
VPAGVMFSNGAVRCGGGGQSEVSEGLKDRGQKDNNNNDDVGRPCRAFNFFCLSDFRLVTEYSVSSSYHWFLSVLYA